MSVTASSFMASRTGVCAVLEMRHRTVIMGVEAELQDSWGSPVDGDSESYVLWALTIPMPAACFADGAYTATMPIPLAFARFVDTPDRRALVVLQRWDIHGGTRSALLLASVKAPPELVREALEAALDTRQRTVSLPTSPMIVPVVKWGLSGTEMTSHDLLAEAEWQPLLHRRWYELKDFVREGTVVPYKSTRAGSRKFQSSVSHHSRPCTPKGNSSALSGAMFAGDVKEADAVSMNRACVMWTDGVVGLLDEVRPYCRVYQPARQEKTIRVRRFPHRYADVVGIVPFGQHIVAFGRATDPFTSEKYVLVYLPSGEDFAAHIRTYDLTCAEAGRYIWGWSKLEGTSGLPLLVEVEDTNASASETLVDPGSGRAAALSVSDALFGTRRQGDGPQVLPFSDPTFYTPVRDSRPVRIRSKPSLSSSVLREMETNEVRAAVALVTVPLCLTSNTTTHVPVNHVFLEWQKGGYSLLRNSTESFLAPVQLSRVPRRFPIDTRSGGDDLTATPELLDLRGQRVSKRRRSWATSETEDEGSKLADFFRPHRASMRVAPDASLLSPRSLPKTLQESLRKGVVRLEDLPTLSGGSEVEVSDSGSDFSGTS